MSNASEVSVIIPTYNRKRSLMRCLKQMPSDVEVIVVDDGSVDGTSEAVRALHKSNIRCLTTPNSGPASARNAGIEVAGGDFIAFTDDDCVPLAPWPVPLVERLRKSDPDIAGAGGRVKPLTDSIIARYYTIHRILEPPASLSYLVTANCCYRREVLELVGGFDTRLKEAGGEDPGLSIKIRKKGFSFVYEPEAVVYHDYRNSVLDFARTFYRYGRGCSLVMDF